MVDVLIELVRAHPDDGQDDGTSFELNEELERHLAANGFPTRPASSGLTAAVSSIDDCDRLGNAIAQFIDASTQQVKLHLDGPTGVSLIHRLGQEEDRQMIASALALCAALI
jgi:hypothetical protein